MPSITTVLFDLDGTLVDSAPGIQYAIEAAWAAVLPQLPCPDMRCVIGPGIRQMFQRVLPQVDADTLAMLERHYRVVYDSEGCLKAVPFPGVAASLHALRAGRVRCLGVTNKPQVPTQRLLGHCGLGEYFDVFLSPNSRTPPFASKAEATQTLMAQSQIDPSRALFMGDTIEDAHVAQTCGLGFIAFRQGYGWPELESMLPMPVVCNRFEDLPSLVLNNPARV